MLKKLLTGGLAAGALAVPLAGLAWADPAPNPAPPVPGANGQPASANEPTCVVSQNTPVQAPAGANTAPGSSAWHQVATLQGSVASDLGLPPGQTVKVYCAPGGAAPAAQPTGYGNTAQQPIGTPGQPGTPPAEQGSPQNPAAPGQPSAPQNPAPGQ